MYDAKDAEKLERILFVHILQFTDIIIGTGIQLF